MASSTPPSSPLLLLPSELRLEIYQHLHNLSGPAYPHFHAPYLPLLLTCRTIHVELAPLLPSWINYTFPNPAALIGHFSAIGEEGWRNIRYVTLSGRASGDGKGMRVWMKGAKWDWDEEGDWGGDQGYTYYGISAVMGLWHGLRLEQLVVEFDKPGSRHDNEFTVGRQGDYVGSRMWEQTRMFQEAEWLVERGKGWREVVLRLPEVACMAKSAAMALKRERKKLKDRDEGGTVEQFVVDFRGKIWEVEEAWEFEESTVGYGETVEYKIRRGEGASYTQDCETEDVFDQQLLKIFRSRSWKQIQEEGLYLEEGLESWRR